MTTPRRLNPLAVNSHGLWRDLVRLYGPVDPPYRAKARQISLSSVLWSPLRGVERAFARQILQTQIEHPPIFIIGHWRSGTTHLHNLMTRDPALGWLSTFQTFAPSASIVGRRILLRAAMARTTPPRRPMDNMELGVDLPQEDEFAIMNASPHSMYHGFNFPRRMDELFTRYCLMEELDSRELHEWRCNYLHMLKKATLLNRGKRLVLKNPVNTARVRELLHLVPDARFIHIVRNPYRLYHSTQLLFRATANLFALQDHTDEDLAAHVLRFYREMMTKFFSDRAAIPPENFVEVRYEDLVTDPLPQLERIYRALRLPGWNDALPRIEAHVTQQAGYKPNRLELSPDDQALVRDHWGFAIDHWNYSTD